MLNELFGVGLFVTGLAVGWFLTKQEKTQVPALDINVGDLGLSCSHTKTFELDEDEDELDVEICSNRATVIRNGASICDDHEQEYISTMTGTSAPDSLEGFDD